MKRNNKILSLFLISIFSAEPIVGLEKANIAASFAARISSFSKAVNNLVRENKDRHQKLQAEIKGLKLNSGKTDLAAEEAKLEVALKSMSEIYGKLSENLAAACVHNKAVRNLILKLPKLDINSKKFFEVSKQVLSYKSHHLKTVIENTSHKTAAARENLDKFNEKVIDISGTLAFIKQSLTMLGDSLKEDLKNKNRVASEQIERLLKDVKVYTRWFEVSASNLRNMAIPDEKLIQKLERTVMRGKPFLDIVKNFLSGDDLKKQKPEAIVFYSDKVTSIVQEISDVCIDVNRDWDF